MVNEILAASVDYTYVFDRAGAITYANPAGAEVLGLTPADVAGKTWSELGALAGTMEPIDAQRERVALTRRPLSGTLQLPSDQGIRTWEYTLNPLCAPDGSLELIIARVSDMTDRRRAEETHPSVSPLAESIADGFLWVADLTEEGDRLHWDLRLDEAVAQRVFPLDVEPGQSYASALYWARLDEDRLRADAHAAREIRAGRGYGQEFRCRGKDGRVRLFSEEVRLETVQPGRWRAVGICRDITDLRQEAALDPHDEQVLQEQMARADAERRCREAQEDGRRKDEFLAMLAHELRNPLAPILNAVQVMRLRGRPDPPVERAREVVERQVRHMARLLDDLLDVARITRGRIELRKEVVDLSAVVADALQTSRPFIEAQRHEVLIALPPEPLWLEADSTRLEQVITNLLTNAAKYTEAEGRIWITAEREADEAVLRVRDTGVGISPELMPHIFDLFTQADRSLDRSQGGLGIGLTLARRLIEMHGGCMSAESPGPGQGSEFVVRLPIRDFGFRISDLGFGTEQDRQGVQEEGGPFEAGSSHPSTAACPIPNPKSEIRNLKSEGVGRRVLLVEDHADAAQMLAEVLEEWGHEVCVALDGPMALEAVAEFQPEVVLLDIGLPGMDGYEVARRLRQQPGLSQTLLVALTGYGRAEDRHRAREAGFQWHLAKPVDPGELERLLAGQDAEGMQQRGGGSGAAVPGEREEPCSPHGES